MRTTITFRFEEGQHPDLEAVRIAVQTIDMLGIGEHARLKRLVTGQWKTELGIGQDEDEQAKAERTQEVEIAPLETIKVREEEKILLDTYMRWCAISAATVSVKVVTRSTGKKAPKELDPEDIDGWPWDESSMAALGWDKPQGILRLPVDLVGAWQTQAEIVNPGIFGRPLTGNYGPKKKSTGVLAVV